VNNIFFVVFEGLMIPFIGTSAGSLMVLFMKKNIKTSVQSCLSGFASGIMMAASVWSLIIPAIEQASEKLGKYGVIHAVAGFCVGILFLMFLDYVNPHFEESVEKTKCNIKKKSRLVFAVVLHNVPEGMAVGAIYAGWLSGNTSISASAALALSIGIAIQNFPEGAIISMPLHASGMSKKKSCIHGILSGVVEPVAGVITILLSSIIIPALPFLLCFAAGAMIYVVVEELIPEIAAGDYSRIGTIFFMSGFSIMMVLDVVLG